MSAVVVSRTTSGRVADEIVVVVGITTLTIEVAIFGIAAAGEVPEIAEIMTEPDTSPTWISLITRLFVFFNNWIFWRGENTTLVIFAPLIFALVKLALVTVAPDKSALASDAPTNVEPVTLALTSEAPVRTVLVNVEFVKVAPVRTAFVMVALANVVPVIIAFAIAAPGIFTVLNVEFVKVTRFIMTLVIVAPAKDVPETSAFERVAPARPAVVNVEFRMVEPDKSAFVRVAPENETFVTVVLDNEAPAILTSLNARSLVMVVPCNDEPASVTVMTHDTLDGALYNDDAACDAMIVAVPGPLSVTNPEDELTVRMELSAGLLNA